MRSTPNPTYRSRTLPGAGVPIPEAMARLNWTVDRATSFAIEELHFAWGTLRNAGAHDSNYVGVVIKRG
jgi:hypothetical protein